MESGSFPVQANMGFSFRSGTTRGMHFLDRPRNRRRSSFAALAVRSLMLLWICVTIPELSASGLAQSFRPRTVACCTCRRAARTDTRRSKRIRKCTT